MNKEKFLDLAGKLFDQANPQQDKITLDKNLLDEIQDQIASEIHDSGTDLINDYELTMSYREVELEDVTFDIKRLNRIIESVFEMYFEAKDQTDDYLATTQQDEVRYQNQQI